MRHLGRTATLIATITMFLLGLALATPAAFAVNLVAPDSDPSTPSAAYPTTHAGMAGWEITLIAVGAVLALAVAALIWRARPRPALHPAAR